MSIIAIRYMLAIGLNAPDVIVPPCAPRCINRIDMTNSREVMACELVLHLKRPPWPVSMTFPGEV
jgi:hypothetical protein